jgi:hypothetical protein
MERESVEQFAGLVVAAALLIGLGSLVLAVIMLFSAEWVAASIAMLSAAVTISRFLQIFFS